MRYSKVQTKITCGTEERVVNEATYFHYDGYDKSTIETWLSHSSVFHILRCLLKSRWNKKTIREKAISHIDFQKKYEETKQKMITAYQKQLKEKETPAQQKEESP